jgi:uncharacterized protein with NAD-binding domain and iron-sulfur cluster
VTEFASRATDERRPIRVAVIGGGCASLTAAFELTRPEHRGRYRVTVYQQGFRLGGKGASGRGPRDRIEEHGLHLWMGWYENAFRLMRECYAELARDPSRCRIATWRDAFEPDHFVGTLERKPDGGWQYWQAYMPPGDGLPGDPLPPGHRFTITHYLIRSLSLVRNLLQTLAVRESSGATSPPLDALAASAAPDRLAKLLSRLANFSGLAALAASIEAAALLETLLGAQQPLPENAILRFLDAISRNAREQIDQLSQRDDEVRRLWTIVDLTTSSMRGIVRHGLLTDPSGFESIDDYDCREWLLHNGASRQTVHSSFINALYDLVFAYEDGDPERPRIAAGQALRATIRSLFTYRGAYFWKMQSGMGDVVFAPLYEVLKARGVRFEFFHRLENVSLASAAARAPDEAPHVEGLEFEVQANVKLDSEGRREYRPLIDVRGLPCWPARPLYEQLEQAEGLRERDFESFWDRGGRRKTLRVIDDFDLVVLGVGIGAIPHVCREIVATNPRWRAAVDFGKTVPTQAFQIWMSTDMKELGWLDDPINVSGFVEPFDSWADMRHLIREESWSGEPRSIAYFCNSLADREPAADRDCPEQAIRQRERVRENCVRFLERDVVHLWPRAARAPGQFRWDVLVDPGATSVPPPGALADAKRFDSQFWTANVNPSDRYAQSLPGSLRYRISPLDYDYDNLTVAGDWTACGFDAGCVEAAVMSGLLAANAIAGTPRLEEIIGYDHP